MMRQYYAWIAEWLYSLQRLYGINFFFFQAVGHLTYVIWTYVKYRQEFSINDYSHYTDIA